MVFVSGYIKLEPQLATIVEKAEDRKGVPSLRIASSKSITDICGCLAVHSPDFWIRLVLIQTSANL